MCKVFLIINKDSVIILKDFEKYQSTLKQNSIFQDILNDPNKYMNKYITGPLNFEWGSNVIPLLFSALATDGNILGKSKCFENEFF